MSSPRFLRWTDPAIRVVSAGLGAAVAGPLGGAIGGWLGGVFGASAGQLIENYAVKFGEKGGEKLLETLTGSLTGSLIESPHDLEYVWREALRLSLEEIHEHVREESFESWFSNWELSLASSAPLNLPWITPDLLQPLTLDSLFQLTMERLESQGSAIRQQALSISTSVRSIPVALLAELTERLPRSLQENFHALIVRKENDEAWKEMNLIFHQLLSNALGLVPQIASETAEIHRLLEDELVRALGDGRVAREEVRAARNREETLNTEIQTLRDQYSQTARLTPARPWNVPERNEFFSGRSDYLQTLRRNLSQCGAAAVTQKASRAISGLGGMGKTQTAVEYAWRYREIYTAAFFVLADSQSNVDAGFATIARLVGEPPLLDDAVLAARAKDWLQQSQHAGWLLILDNVDDVAHIKHRIPGTGGDVLITTRLNSVGRLAREIELPRMDAEEGATFLLQRANRMDANLAVDLAGVEGRAALELSTIMGGLPLALEQAGAYIVEMSSSPAEYLRFFREEGVNLLGRAAADSDHDSVLVTFNLAFERLSEPARDVLRLCSLLAPEGIPEEVIVGKQPGRDAREAIGEAARYSLLTIRKLKSTSEGIELTGVDIHRLVQEVVRNRMSSAERQSWVERALKAVNQTVFGTDEMENRWKQARELQSQRFAPYRMYREEVESFAVPLDPVPYIVSPQEWRAIEKAIIQRATLLDALLADVYGPQRLKALVPAKLIQGNPGYFPACASLPAANGRHLRLYAADICRVEDGTWMVVDDRTSIPSGLSYALENRSVLSRIVPETLLRFEIRSLTPFLEDYLSSVGNSAPQHRDNPHVVLLSPGPYNAAYFEHAYLAHQCRFTLVESRDLLTTSQGVFQHTVSGPRPVDVIVRRVDTNFCDPLVFRSDSLLGVPGLVDAVRRGQVGVVNALGSDFASDRILRPWLAQLCELFLSEQLLMPSVPTLWCGDQSTLLQVEERLDQLIIFDVHNSHTPVTGLSSEGSSRDGLLKMIREEPARFMAQEVVKAPLLPTGTDAKGYAVLHVFATAVPGGYSVMPGGSCTVVSARRANDLFPRAIAAKDIWVIGGLEPEPDPGTVPPVEAPAASAVLSRRLADSFFWLGRYAERLDFCVLRLLDLLRVLRENDPEKAGLGHLLVALLVEMGALAIPNKLDVLDSRSVREAIGAAYFDKQPNSLGEMDRAILENSRSVELLLPRNAVAAIRRTRAIFARALPVTALEDPEQSLRDVIAAIADFRAELETSNWRDTGWHLLQLGRHLESFQLAGQVLEYYGRDLIPDAESTMLSDAGRIASHIKSLPASAASRLSLDESAVRLDRAILDHDWKLAGLSIQEIMTLLDGTFIAGLRFNADAETSGRPG